MHLYQLTFEGQLHGLGVRSCSDPLANQRSGHRVERPGDFDMFSELRPDRDEQPQAWGF